MMRQQQPNILLIGDDPARMARLRAILSRTARVVQAEDLQQALKRLALKNSEEFEAVFTDWRFHCGTWRDALNQIGNLHPDLPIVVVYNSEELARGSRDWREVISAGAFDLLPSSCGDLELLSLAEQAVASARARALLATA
jgi:DNA-binding NtrC family response regulator